jgi:hypothetical protein
MGFRKLYFFRSFIIIAVIIFNGCVPIDQSSSGSGNSGNNYPSIKHEDLTYDEDFKSVRLYPSSGRNTDILNPPVIPLSQPFPLVLEFDELFAERETFNAKIIHCDSDWKKSALSDMEFLFEFNEFQINDFQISLNSKPKYVHYKLRLPKVKASGNYIIKVYRGTDEKDVVLTRRFMVFENLVNVGAEVGISNNVELRQTHQQVDIMVSYDQLSLVNPFDEIRVVIRQNQRWDNMITNLKPTQVREQVKTLEYRHFDQSNKFWAGNEFRFFDLRTVNYLGQNVAKIFNETNRIDALLLPDKSRNNQVYSQYNDINGKYFIETQEAGTHDPNTDGFYLNTIFNLRSEKLPGSEVYILGEMTDWKLDKSNRMNYDLETKSYKKDLLLKQGIYNFKYLVKGAHEPYFFEGSHFETENQYEVFVYYKPLGGRVDRLAGYTTITYNKRR